MQVLDLVLKYCSDINERNWIHFSISSTCWWLKLQCYLAWISFIYGSSFQLKFCRIFLSLKRLLLDWTGSLVSFSELNSKKTIEVFFDVKNKSPKILEARAMEKKLWKEPIGLHQNVNWNILKQNFGEVKAQWELISDAHPEVLSVRCKLVFIVWETFGLFFSANSVHIVLWLLLAINRKSLYVFKILKFYSDYCDVWVLIDVDGFCGL